ncbi:2OG-Fe(II) oxygenase [Roseateles sp. DC23W]|uniref:2OG-Fe(II) oxygenase n=1 Tax=Pelomonas dachongensis TaxID=3299029 RepID=A0ABW7ELB5_9BURK
MTIAAISTSPDEAHAARLFKDAQARTRDGDVASARTLLQQAAQAAHLPALLQLGVWDLLGMAGPVDLLAAVERVRDAAQRGYLPAMTLYAQLVAAGAGGLARDFGQVLSLLSQAARGGEPRAAVQLAMLMPDVPEHSQTRRALLQRAAAGGESIARMFIERMPPIRPHFPLDWDVVLRGVAWPHERVLPAVAVRNEHPRIVAWPGLLSPDECIYMALKGLPLLRPARITGVDGRPAVDPIRSNEAAMFGLLEADAVVQSLDLRVAAALGHPVENGEGFALLRYQVGQQYLPHCDWIDPERTTTRADLDRWGQRVATCVVYLNDGFEGGATGFPELGLEFRGGVGDALAWDNVRPDGQIDPLTLHAGRPPTQGMKYLLSKWMRDRSQSGNAG